MAPPHARPRGSRLARRVLDVPPSGIRKFFDVLATMPDVISLGVGRAGLHHAAADRRGGRSVASLGTHPLHQQLRDHRAAHARSRATSSGCTAWPTTPTRRSWSPWAPREALGVALAAILDPATRSSSTSRRTWHTSRASCSRARPRCSCPPSADRRLGSWTRPRWSAPSRPRTKALFLGYPCNPTGAVLDAETHPGRRGHRGTPRPAGHQRRDLRPAGVRRPSPRGVQRAARACATGPSCWAASPRPTP